MVSARAATALAGVLVSLALSVALWFYFDTLLFFLFVPFVPFLLRGRGESERRTEVAECPVCGYRTAESGHDYCPRDGTRLERRGQSSPRRRGRTGDRRR